MEIFQVGRRVVLLDKSLKIYNEDGNYYCEGVVQEVLRSGKYLVKWDSDCREPNPERVKPEDLVSEEEARKILSTLEKEYEIWATPIKNKIKQAASLLQEAGRLANKQDTSIMNMHDAVSSLLRAMEDCGWSTSSLSLLKIYQ